MNICLLKFHMYIFFFLTDLGHLPVNCDCGFLTSGTSSIKCLPVNVLFIISSFIVEVILINS